MIEKTKNNQKEGFTLVELAIVLVIIGLIIGGVLVGQDMIKSAEIRATVSQWEKYNAAVNVFRDKYGVLPGDMGNNKAVEFGFLARGGWNIENNGFFEGCTTATPLLAGCDNLMFWRDLNTANLIDGYFQVAQDDQADGTGPIETNRLILFFPEAKIGRGNFWIVYPAQGKNWYQVTGITEVAGSGDYTLTTALSPFEAYNIDRKTDDSRSITGGTRAMADLSFPNVPAIAGTAVGGTTCIAADGTYNQTTETNANTPACQLRLKFM